MSDPNPTRRRVARLLTSLLGLGLARAVRVESSHAQEAPRDQGIGGTGAAPVPPPVEGGDRGIGGTGVIGTIRRFGSIVVNDLRITYPKDVRVSVDGAPATVAALRLGQVVRVVAHERDGVLATRRIDVTSEVVGPVEAVAGRRLTVLGQSVLAPGTAQAARWKVGDRVAVSGLRRGDGTVVASLIEARPEGPARVAGPVRRGSDGALRIGSLRLEGLDPRLVGQRASIAGSATGTDSRSDASLRVTQAQGERAPFAPGLTRISIEGYAVREASGLRLGSGLRLTGTAEGLLAGDRRSVVTGRVDAEGRARVEAVHPQGAGRGPGPGGGSGPAGPGGAGPSGGSGGGGPSGGGPGGGGPGGSRPGNGGPGGPGSGAGPRGGFEIDRREPSSGFGAGEGHSGGPGAPRGFGGPSGGFGGPGGGFGGPGGGFGGPGGGPGGPGGGFGGPGGRR